MRKLRSLSIAIRLGLLFSAIAALILSSLGAYLYHTLAAQMSQRDVNDLLQKAVVLRTILTDRLAPPPAASSTVKLLATVAGDGGVVQVTGANATVLLQVGVAPSGLNGLAAVPIDRLPHPGDVAELATPSGYARALALRATTRDGAAITISLARERSERLAVLRRYAGDLVGALLVGAAVATLLAFWIVRHGLWPLREISAQADAISTHRLKSRLDIEQAPTELRALSIAFNAMLDRLEDGVQRLSGFAADLAHDMRTPLNTLMIETQVALSRPRSVDEYQAVLASNLEEYERLARMIENTLFLARAENAQLDLTRAALDATKELARLFEYFEGLAEEANVNLVLAPSSDSVALLAEPILFQRAVGNLISNAIAHTPAGGSVHLAAKAEGQHVLVSVSNTGDGIPPDQLKRIFDRYYRGDAARTGRTSSVGLGLSIVAAIMALHGGSVTVTSQPGGLTTFVLKF